MTVLFKRFFSRSHSRNAIRQVFSSFPLRSAMLRYLFLLVVFSFIIMFHHTFLKECHTFTACLCSFACIPR